MNNIKLLLISYTFYPDINPRAIRWNLIAEKLLKSNFQLTIVTKEKVLVFNSYVDLLNYRLQFISQNTATSYKNLKEGFLRKTFKAIVRLIYWPDYAFIWILPSLIKGVDLINNNRFNALISISHPFSSHIVGLFLKLKFRNIKWIIDIGDPFSLVEKPFQNNIMLYKHINRFAEKYILKRSEIVSVTISSLKDEYINNFGINAEKIKVIPPLLSIDRIKPIKNHVNYHQQQAINLSYFGTLYKDLRSPKHAIDILSKLDFEIILNFYGLNNITNESFSSIGNLKIIFHGVVTQEQMIVAISASDCLLNIGNASKYQLPSKLIEYVSTGKPILNFASIDGDTSIKFLENYSSKLTIDTSLIHKDDINIIIALASFLTNLPQVNSEEVSRYCDLYSHNNVASKYVDLLDEVF
jgi:hypothetical protein